MTKGKKKERKEKGSLEDRIIEQKALDLLKEFERSTTDQFITYLFPFLQNDNYVVFENYIQRLLLNAKDPTYVALKILTVLNVTKNNPGNIKKFEHVVLSIFQTSKIEVALCPESVAIIREMLTTFPLPKLMNIVPTFKYDLDDATKQNWIDGALELVKTPKTSNDGVKILIFCAVKEKYFTLAMNALLDSQNFQLAQSFVGTNEEMRFKLIDMVEERCRTCLQSGKTGYKVPLKSYAGKAHSAAKSWDIPIQRYENLRIFVNLGALRYLTYSRRQATGNVDNWNELIEFLCLQFPALEFWLLKEMMHSKDHDGFVYFQKLLKIDDNIALPLYYSVNWSDVKKTPNKGLQVEKDYVKMSVGYTMVDTDVLLKECVNDLLTSGNLLGIDLEWSPSFVGENFDCALFQIADEDHAYLIDVLALSDESIDKFIFNVFQADVKILGYDLSNDKKLLLKLSPSLDPVQADKMLVDLAAYQNEIYNKCQRTEYKISGLASLCKLWLSRELDKSNQISNWCRRPLREAQMSYAALDAHILILIFYRMESFLNDWTENGKDSEPVQNSDLPHFEGQTKKDIVSDHRKMQQALNMKPRKTAQIYFAVDHSIQRLGRKLRSCGIDTYIHNGNLTEFQNAVLDDNRIVLTVGETGFFRAKAYASPENIYIITKESARDTNKQLKEVLEFFNVLYNDGDVLSRCVKCNSADFKIVAADYVAKYHSGIVPNQVLQKTNKFFLCQGCQRIYWEGAQFNNVKEHLGALFKE